MSSSNDPRKTTDFKINMDTILSWLCCKKRNQTKPEEDDRDDNEIPNQTKPKEDDRDGNEIPNQTKPKEDDRDDTEIPKPNRTKPNQTNPEKDVYDEEGNITYQDRQGVYYKKIKNEKVLLLEAPLQ
jgi:hypothetical protein